MYFVSAIRQSHNRVGRSWLSRFLLLAVGLRVSLFVCSLWVSQLCPCVFLYLLFSVASHSIPSYTEQFGEWLLKSIRQIVVLTYLCVRCLNIRRSRPEKSQITMSGKMWLGSLTDNHCLTFDIDVESLYLRNLSKPSGLYHVCY